MKCIFEVFRNNKEEPFIMLTQVKLEQKGYCSLSLNSIPFPITLPPASPFLHSSLAYRLRLPNKQIAQILFPVTTAMPK